MSHNIGIRKSPKARYSGRNLAAREKINFDKIAFTMACTLYVLEEV